MKFSRRRVLRLAAAGTVLTSTTRFALAEAYPFRPVHMVVGYPPGLTPDIVARLIAQSLSQSAGQQFIVDNRAGAGSNIGTEVVVRATPDGYTLLVMTFANATNATLYEGLNFDIVRDIAPVAGTFQSPLVLTATLSFPATTVPELIAYTKANPGKVNFASAGYGTVNNVSGELFNMMADVKMVHVPYRGSYVPDLIGGQVQICFAPIPSTIEFIRSGKLRAIAVTGTERSEALPGIPTVAESLPGYEAIVWHGIGAPKDTPAEIISTLNEKINAVLADPLTKQRFGVLGGTILGGSPADFGKFLSQETEKWAKVIRAAGIKSE